MQGAGGGGCLRILHVRSYSEIQMGPRNLGILHRPNGGGGECRESVSIMFPLLSDSVSRWTARAAGAPWSQMVAWSFEQALREPRRPDRGSNRPFPKGGEVVAAKRWNWRHHVANSTGFNLAEGGDGDLLSQAATGGPLCHRRRRRRRRRRGGSPCVTSGAARALYGGFSLFFSLSLPRDF